MFRFRYIFRVCKQKLLIIIFNIVTKYRQCHLLFNAKDKALNKNLHQFKEYGWQRILAEFSEKNWKKTND